MNSSTDTPHLDFVQNRMAQLAPGSEGKLWGRSSGNALQSKAGDGSWLKEVPGCLGMADPDTECANGKAPGTKRHAEAIEEVIASAEKWVDITSLGIIMQNMDIADGIFMEHIIAGMKRAIDNNPQVVFRMLQGDPTASLLQGIVKRGAWFIKSLENKLGKAYYAKARIIVATQQTEEFTSWNHAKIVAADGKIALVGGTNMWDGDYYNSPAPVTDIGMVVRGPAAAYAHKFADLLWGPLCDTPALFGISEIGYSKKLCPEQQSTTCQALYCKEYTKAQLPPQAPLNLNSEDFNEGVEVLALGQLGLGVEGPGGDDVPLCPADEGDTPVACSGKHVDAVNGLSPLSLDRGIPASSGWGACSGCNGCSACHADKYCCCPVGKVAVDRKPWCVNPSPVNAIPNSHTWSSCSTSSGRFEACGEGDWCCCPAGQTGTTAAPWCTSTASGRKMLNSQMELYDSVYDTQRQLADSKRYSMNNPQEEAIRALVASATNTIYAAQQDLYWGCGSTKYSANFDIRLVDALVERMLAGVEVTIVVSPTLGDTFRQRDLSAGMYVNMPSLHILADYLVARVQHQDQAKTKAEAQQFMCEHLRYASYRITKNFPTWSNGWPNRLHSKTWMVDDAAFYIGSQNAYPAVLQEFGFIVENKQAALEYKRDFFDPVWEYSQENGYSFAERADLTGGKQKCQFIR
jgi:phosphatidylserine/phosphatidylglycerophosphate/cardiolipin synthase-like enzyme